MISYAHAHETNIMKGEVCFFTLKKYYKSCDKTF